jgi:hypothetical protein
LGESGRRGISTAVAQVAILLVALAVGLIALGIFMRNISIATASSEREAGMQAVKSVERLTLVYWARDGRAWIANDGPDQVYIAQIYVDANPVWSSATGTCPSGPGCLQSKETKIFRVGYGQSLIVKTGTGMLHVLRREEVR